MLKRVSAGMLEVQCRIPVEGIWVWALGALYNSSLELLEFMVVVGVEAAIANIESASRRSCVLEVRVRVKAGAEDGHHASWPKLSVQPQLKWALT